MNKNLIPINCNYQFRKGGKLFSNLRTFDVKIIPATNYRGTRVKIFDNRHSQSKTLGYDYQVGNIAEQAITWLENNLSIDIIGFSHIDKTGHYILITDNFDKLINPEPKEVWKI